MYDTARPASEFYPAFREQLEAALGSPPRLALYTCSDEANHEAARHREAVFGPCGGVFVTRMVGGQVFHGQLDVALASGHTSNAFEVNVHVGLLREDGRTEYGRYRGRDGAIRSTCGAMRHILTEYVPHPEREPQVSREVNGVLTLDFIATLAYRMRPRFAEIAQDPEPMVRAALVNLDVQINALVGYLRILGPQHHVSQLAIAGTVSWNDGAEADRVSLERFLRLSAPEFLPEPG